MNQIMNVIITHKTNPQLVKMLDSYTRVPRN